MKLNSITHWAELEAAQFLAQKANDMKKILHLTLSGFKIVFISVVWKVLLCVTGLHSKEDALHLLWKAKSLLKTLTQLWQMQLSQKNTSLQLLCNLQIIYRWISYRCSVYGYSFNSLVGCISLVPTVYVHNNGQQCPVCWRFQQWF